MPRAEMLRQRAPKKTHCMPTHLADEEALHVAQEAYERGWSHSQYIRSRRRLAAIAQGAPASNYERKEIRHAERLTGVHMPDACTDCPHAEEGWDGCCGGAV